MIRPAQRVLVERARTGLALDEASFSTALRRWGGADQIDGLTGAGFDRLMDHFTVCGFRDRRRPVLSSRTLELLDGVRRDFGISDFRFETMLRICGVADLRDLDGRLFLHLLAMIEPYGLNVPIFMGCRREISTSQLRLIQVARRKIECSDVLFFGMLQEWGGVNSAGDLDRRGIALIMAALERDGFRRSPLAADKPGFGRRPGFASPEQVALIRSLWREWSGSDVEAELNAWLDRSHRVSSLRFLTTAGAGKAISSLKAMKARQASQTT